MNTTLPASLRSKVQTIRTFSELDSLTIGRYSLRLNDVIGLRYHPDKALWRLIDARNKAGRKGSDVIRLSSLAKAAQADVVPTLVVHVPSSLNPGYQDVTIPFGPKTMSWLHRPLEAHAYSTPSGRPRVVVPLHLKRNHPAVGHSTRKPGPHVPPTDEQPSPRGDAMVTFAPTGVGGGDESGVNDDDKEGSTVVKMADGETFRLKHDEREEALRDAAKAQPLAKARLWTEGWLPFPLHDASAREAAIAAARRAMRRPKGGWRHLLRRENAAGGTTKLLVDDRLHLGDEDETLGSAVTFKG